MDNIPPGVNQPPTNDPSPNTDAKNHLTKLENLLELYLVKKAPFALPAGLKEFIVKFSPWINLVFLILFLPALLAAIGFSAMMSPWAYRGMFGYGYGFGYYLQLILGGVAFVLQLIALPGLFKRQLSAWNLIFYSVLVAAVADFVRGNIMGLIIGTLFGLYILFQIKSYYK